MNFAYFARGREQTQFTQGRWTTLDNPHSIFQWREPIEGKLAGMTLMTLTPCIQRICQAIDHWRRHHRGHLWSQLNRHANVFDDNSEESAWIAWDAVDATAGVLQNLLEGHCGLKSHQVSPSLCSACPATSTQTIHMFHIVPQPICPKSKICPLSLCVLAIGSVQSPFEVRILFPLWPSPGFTWGKGERASVQWDQIEYILLCKIPSHIQSTQSMRKRNVVGWYNSEHWQWYGYGSIPIHTIFRGMNIHLPANFDVHQGDRVLTHPHLLIGIGQGTKDGCDLSCGQTVKLTDWFTKSALTSSQSPTSSSCVRILLVRIGVVRQVTPWKSPPKALRLRRMNQKQQGPTHQKNQAPKKKGRNANCTRSEMPKNMVFRRKILGGTKRWAQGNNNCVIAKENNHVYSSIVFFHARLLLDWMIEDSPQIIHPPRGNQNF